MDGRPMHREKALRTLSAILQNETTGWGLQPIERTRRRRLTMEKDLERDEGRGSGSKGHQ